MVSTVWNEALKYNLILIILDWRGSRFQTGESNCNTNYSRSESGNFKNFISSILPPPPDVRNVVIRNPERYSIPEWMNTDVPPQPLEFGTSTTASTVNTRQVHKQDVTISNCNTTLIGDYTAVAFPDFQSKWFVQATGTATFTSVTSQIRQGDIAVNRKYIFIALGANQIRTAEGELEFQWILNLVVAIRERNNDSRIFITGVLPRPVENLAAKPLITKLNRWLVLAVNRVQALFKNVKFLPVQLRFITGTEPIVAFFHPQDRITC